MTRLFGFVQLDLPGTLTVADGRYVLRDERDERGERVLVTETIGAPPPARRRRRKPKEASSDASPSELPLARVTLVRAFEAFEDEPRARAWLDSTLADEDALDGVLEDAIGDLNRALHTQAVASGDPRQQALIVERASAARVGYGGGEELVDGGFTHAQAIDPARGSSRRRARAEELQPQQRLAAVLGGREQLDACEALLLRARADFDANRPREAALQLRIGLEALLVELDDALDDAGHRDDMAKLRAVRESTIKLANSALNSNLSSEQLQLLSDSLARSERVLRRRRILSG